MAAIDAEVGIRGKYDGIGKCFGHPHETGISEAHGDIGVFLQQLEHSFHVIVKIEICEDGTALKQSTEAKGSTRAEKMEGVG
jgi:hypothetical protein